MGIPHLSVEPLETAMKMVRPIISTDLDGPPVQGEPAALDSIAITAAGRTEIAGAPGVAGEVVEAKHHIRQSAVPVRHQHRDEPRPRLLHEIARAVGADAAREERQEDAALVTRDERIPGHAVSVQGERDDPLVRPFAKARLRRKGRHRPCGTT